MKILLFLLLTTFYQVTNAQIFKCITSAGKITYSESECPKHMKGGELFIEDNVIDSSYLRGKVESSKNQKSTTSTTIVTTQSTKKLNGNSINYMTSFDKTIRLNQLKVQMTDQSFSEKVMDAKNEYAVLNMRRPKMLGYDKEQLRKNLKVDLTHPDQKKRQTAMYELASIYQKY